MVFIENDIVSIDKAAKVIYSKFIVEHFSSHGHQNLILENINNFFSTLKKDLKVFIEYPYVDRVYRDSYYFYFSTKHKNYSRDCIRISFFSNSFSYKDFSEPSKQEELGKKFLGYCVIRPTFPQVIGRNLISKNALLKQNFVACLHYENVLINGFKLSISGYPHSSQDGESITCAETTIWALMEYFGHKYAEYKPVLPSLIINKLNERSDRRMLPSNGLTVEQISYVLKDFGFGTVIYSKEVDGLDFLQDLAVYVESGIPVIVAIENSNSTIVHAILIIGREKISKTKLITVFNETDEIIHQSVLNLQYVFQDDNLNPYTLATLSKPAIAYGRRSSFYSCTITSFVVPLYKKIYLEAKLARSFILAIFEDKRYGGKKTNEQYLFRPFLASNRSFKQHIACLEKMDVELKNYIISLSMPRFIYCGEFLTKNDVVNETVSSLVILDATEIGDNWQDSFIFAAHNKNGATTVLFNTPNEILGLEFALFNYKMYNQNLN